MCPCSHAHSHAPHSHDDSRERWRRRRSFPQAAAKADSENGAESDLPPGQRAAAARTPGQFLSGTQPLPAPHTNTQPVSGSGHTQFLAGTQPLPAPHANTQPVSGGGLACSAGSARGAQSSADAGEPYFPRCITIDLREENALKR